MIQTRRLALCAVSSLALLSACSPGAVKNTLGLERSAPDEFRVVPRPALTVPPQFNLRPPASPEEISTQPSTASADAQKLILSNSSKGETFTLKKGTADTAVTSVSSAPLGKPGKGGSISNAESQFLQNAGANNADPKVRSELVRDYTPVNEEGEPEEESSWWNPFGYLNKKKEPTVNPGEEVKRIKANKEDGKPINEGEIPATQPKDRGVLDSVLGK